MTEILDDSAVSEIEDRANMAEPGPWQLGGNYWDRNVVTADKGDHFIADCGKHPMSAEFIAHAREDIPALCRTVKHLWAQLAEWEQHRPGIVEAVQTAETTVDDLQSQLEQLRENEALRKEVANSEKYQAQLLDSDSQAATLHYFKDRGDRRCVTCGNLRLWQCHTDEESDPATGMRDKCVKKVRERARSHRRRATDISYGSSVDVPISSEQYMKLAAECDLAADELESLTLDQVKPGEM